MRLATALLLVALLAIHLWGVTPQKALAHANLESAEPSPNAVLQSSPSRVTLRFSEPVAQSFSSIQVLNSAGRPVQKSAAIVDPGDAKTLWTGLDALANGTYTVAWRNLSTVDGHAVRGSYVFSVGEPLSAVPAAQEPGYPLVQSRAEPFLRWGALLSVLAIFGGIAFQLLIFGPAVAKLPRSEALAGAAKRIRAASARLIGAAGFLFILSSLGLFLVQAGVARDLPWYRTVGEPLNSVMLHTDYGRWWLWRVGLFLAVHLLLAFHGVMARRGRPGDFQFVFPLALAAAAGMLLTFSFTSHSAATAAIRPYAVTSDFFHLLAAGLWAGGLLYLMLALRLLFKHLGEQERVKLLGAMIPRFTTLATVSVAVIVVTGVYGGWAHVTTLRASDTAYGYTLITKIVIVIPLLMLGALNLFWVSKRLAENPRASALLKLFVTSEAALVLLVVLATGWLTSLEPARQADARHRQSSAIQLTQEVNDATVDVRISPGRVGVNSVAVQAKDRRGKIDNASTVRVTTVFLGQDLGSAVAQAQREGDSRYLANDISFSVAGPWQIEVLLVRPNAFDLRAAYRFELGASGAVQRGGAQADLKTGRLLFGVELALIGIACASALVMTGGIRRKAGKRLLAPALAFIVIGLLFAAVPAEPQRAAPALAANPFPPTAASLASGKASYAKYCAACHGDTGKGDGPHAAAHTPPPADLTIHAPLHPEGQLFGYIKNGLPGTQMPPFGNFLTDEEIWHVVNYVKSLAE